MAKAKDAFRTISEVAEWLDTPTHVLRFWESKFSQIKPVKGAGGALPPGGDSTLARGRRHHIHDVDEFKHPPIFGWRANSRRTLY